MDSDTWVPLVLGGGGVALITAVFQGLKSIQQGASAKTRQSIEDLERKTRQSIEDLERWRDEANDAREAAERARDAAIARMYEWKRYAGALEYLLASKGIEPPPNAERPKE